MHAPTNLERENSEQHVILLTANVYEAFDSCVQARDGRPRACGSSPSGHRKAPASPLGYLSGCSTLSGWRNATMPPVTSGRKEKGKCILSRWVKALHVSLNLLHCSLTPSFDFYKEFQGECRWVRPYLYKALSRNRCARLLPLGPHLFHNKIWHEQIILRYKLFMQT